MPPKARFTKQMIEDAAFELAKQRGIEAVAARDVAKALNMTQSAISHQLRILKQNKLVKSRRDGKSIFYSLADGHIKTILSQGIEHINE